MQNASASPVAQSMPSPVSIALLAGLEEALDRAVDVEAVRHLGDLAADFLQRLERHAGRCRGADHRHVAGDLHARPAAVEPVGLVRLVALAGLVLGIEPARHSAFILSTSPVGDDAFADQLASSRSPAYVGCDRIFLYISGWVNAGSSPSLWP